MARWVRDGIGRFTKFLSCLPHEPVAGAALRELHTASHALSLSTNSYVGPSFAFTAAHWERAQWCEFERDDFAGMKFDLVIL